MNVAAYVKIIHQDGLKIIKSSGLGKFHDDERGSKGTLSQMK